MLAKSHASFASFLIICIFWFSTTSIAQAQNEELRRPTRPDVFNSPEEVAQYVKDLHEYVRAKGIRYGKRFAPSSNEERSNQPEMINPSKAENTDADNIDEENPQEQLVQQQMHPLRIAPLYRLLNEIPLPLLVKYLRINQINHQPETADARINQRTMLHPFVRQRIIASKMNF